MPSARPPVIIADFYESSDGPSVLMEVSSPDGIRLFLSALERVASSGPGAIVELVDSLMPASSSVSSFELRNVAPAPTVRLQRYGAEFVWEQATDDWLDTAELVAPLLSGPGHQYLADGLHNHAFIELSVGEHHCRASHPDGV